MHVNTRAITKSRLAEWADELESYHCTPMLMIGFGHDHTKGQLHVLVPEDLDLDYLERVLVWALNQIRMKKL